MIPVPFFKNILMLHLLSLVNYEYKRSRNQIDFNEKFFQLKKASIMSLLAAEYFKEHPRKFIGKSEKHAAKIMKKFCRSKGYWQAFPLLVGSGENTCKIHATPSNRIIRENDIVMIDIGLKRASHYLSDYGSDCTRTFFLGEPTEFQATIYEIVQEAHDLALKLVRPGISGNVLHTKIARFIASRGFELPHGLGHSTRRYTHAKPFLNAHDRLSRLKVNDNVTIEPGIYLTRGDPKLPKGHPPFGVRIEDLIVIRHDGHDVLTSL